MNDRSRSVILLAVSIVVLLFMLIPSSDKDYSWYNSLILILMNIFLILSTISTISIVLWILYRDDYKNISIVKMLFFITTLICTILVFAFAMQRESISIKYIFIDFVLIVANNVDFLVENIKKMIEYRKKDTQAER